MCVQYMAYVGVDTLVHNILVIFCILSVNGMHEVIAINFLYISLQFLETVTSFDL